MKILWGNGYHEPYPSTEAACRASEAGPCQACAVQGDTQPKVVAALDNSSGEYTSIFLCHAHLLELANELL